MINFINIEKLCSWLELHKPPFNMEYLRSQKWGVPVPLPAPLSDCGTVGCALGWAPFVPGLEPIEFGSVFGLHGGQYRRRVFGDLSKNEFDFLFSNKWVKGQNTIEDFCARARTFINGPSIVDRWFRAQCPYHLPFEEMMNSLALSGE